MPLTKAKLKELKQLTHKKFRDETRLFLVEGVRLVHEAALSDFHIEEAFHTADLADHPLGPGVLEALRHKTQNIHLISSRELESLGETETVQSVIAVLRQRQFSPEIMLRCPDAQCTLVAFDGIADPGNVGSMVRTCDWFGVDGIMIGRDSVELYNPKVLRATMGGVFHLPIAEEVDLLSTISKAKEAGFKVYVTDVNGETHYDHVTYDAKSLIIFGNEAWGVSDQVREMADVKLVIRRYGAGESLNVAVACGIVLSSLHHLYD